MTYNNGCKNVEREDTNRVLGTQSYFCEAFHGWAKAFIENAIRLIRRFSPKKTDFHLVTKEQVKRIETLLNARPRKCLDYRTPKKFWAHMLHFPFDCGEYSSCPVHFNLQSEICNLQFLSHFGYDIATGWEDSHGCLSHLLRYLTDCLLNIR